MLTFIVIGTRQIDEEGNVVHTPLDVRCREEEARAVYPAVFNRKHTRLAILTKKVCDPWVEGLRCNNIAQRAAFEILYALVKSQQEFEEAAGDGLRRMVVELCMTIRCGESRTTHPAALSSYGR